MGSMGGSLGGDFPRSPSEQAFQVWAPLSSHVAQLWRQLCLCQHLNTLSVLLAYHDSGFWLSKPLPREAGATSAHSSHGGRHLCSQQPRMFNAAVARSTDICMESRAPLRLRVPSTRPTHACCCAGFPEAHPLQQQPRRLQRPGRQPVGPGGAGSSAALAAGEPGQPGGRRPAVNISSARRQWGHGLWRASRRQPGLLPAAAARQPAQRQRRAACSRRHRCLLVALRPGSPAALLFCPIQAMIQLSLLSGVHCIALSLSRTAGNDDDEGGGGLRRGGKMEPSVGSAFSPPPPSFPSELPPIPGVSTSSSLQLTGA